MYLSFSNNAPNTPQPGNKAAIGHVSLLSGAFFPSAAVVVTGDTVTPSNFVGWETQSPLFKTQGKHCGPKKIKNACWSHIP